MAAKMQDLSQVRWDDVRLFLAAYRHGTLGVAAHKLGLDTSTMSRRLTAFEQALDVQLFDRNRSGLVATRVAEAMLAAAETMEAAHARLTRDASDIERAAEGTVRLSAAPGLADLFVAPALVRLRARYPKLRIELDASVRPLDLGRREADLALRSVQPRGAELLITKLGNARWVAAGAPSLLKKLGRLKRWGAAPWIQWEKDLLSFGAARWIADHIPADSIALSTSHFTSQLAAAESGLGLMLVPEPYLRLKHLAALEIARSLEPATESWPSDDLWLVGHRAQREVPRVAAVWTFLASELRKVLPKAQP
jgi:DNA-binding transcriptional LysR family regulator